ncbi:MAG: PEGA domain-containing protein [Fibromonadales bacterium]|nr:PEGA domain-containing protein [Fibromonadales bacterium]
MIKRLLLFLIVSVAYSEQLLMLDMESDIDSNISVLWEKSIMQVLKESAFKPVKIEPDFFAECENIECVISAARASGAQGLFRGRLRAEGKDSVNIRLRIDWLAGNTSPQTDIQIMAPLAWDEVLKSGILLRMLSGITGKHAEFERAKNKTTFISVETNPDLAVVMLNGEPVCQSPCVVSDSGSMAQIAAYWQSNENLWAAKRMVKLGEDTAKVFLELRRSYAGTEIRSNPGKALVFSAELLDINSRPLGKTPYNLQGSPGETQIRLFHKGYNDTLLNVEIDALEKQIKFVQLSPITDPQKIYEQNLLVKGQTKRNIGLGLLGGSIAPLASGIFLCVLAQDDYEKARKIKGELEQPSFGGKNFKAKIDENHKAVKDGNFKTTVGAGLIGFSLLLAGVGFSISF